MKRNPEQSKLWEGRSRGKTDRMAAASRPSPPTTRRLSRHDIAGSIAHCRTLERAGVLTRREADKLVAGLKQVEKEIAGGRFRFKPAHEDIHMAIEARLTELVGEVGGKLHTGRSRNDQVALDLRLYLRDAVKDLLASLRQFQESLVALAQRELSVVMRGYTHLQRAQPVLFAHHLLAYVEMAERDKGRLRDALRRINVMPLGSGALAGTNYPLDREYTARLLDFPAVSQNSVDAVSDRDFVVETLAALALVMAHASRFAEELVLWSSQEFGFIELPDAFATGSSMMPQKKNPDVPELVRGKTGRGYGNLFALLTVLKGLPLSYNRDLQEDKEPLFDTVDTVKGVLSVLEAMLPQIVFHEDRLREAARGGFTLATDVADYLVEKGLPFRKAHEVVGAVVRWCLAEKKGLEQLSWEEWQRFSPLFGQDLFPRLTLESAVDRRHSYGGTARSEVQRRLRSIGI